MLIQDIRKFGPLSYEYEVSIMPMVRELAVHMGNYKQVRVKEEFDKHEMVSDIDTDGEGNESKVGPDYCLRCRQDTFAITSNKCYKTVGKF